jgi:alpha-glucosidase/alpha-D-xyloside xylohydrolase
MRALWVHFPDDPAAVARGSEFMWGRDILVAPVVAKGATSRKLYLPRGDWYDFWTEDRIPGGREIERPVDLATVPMYVRAGAVIPVGPVKQYVDEPSAEPLTLVVFPGVNGTRTVYDDDGHTFNYRNGEWMGLEASWNDRNRTLQLQLERGSKLLVAAPMKVNVRVAGSPSNTPVEFTGRRVSARP